MNALLVVAHPEPTSFNHALHHTAVQRLKATGWTVRTLDLYEEHFEPRVSREDTQFNANPARFDPQIEAGYASDRGTFAPELDRHIREVLQADLLILQFPMWWFGLPAILKGWVDRVFALGRLYGGGRAYGRGVMRGRRALLSTTTGAPATRFVEGDLGTMDAALWPIEHGILRFVGFEVLPAHVVFGPKGLTTDQRAEHLHHYATHLARNEVIPEGMATSAAPARPR